MIALVLALASSQTPQEPAPPVAPAPRLGIELPPGPAGRAWSELAASDSAWIPFTPWARGEQLRFASATDVWRDAAAWDAWAAAVSSVAAHGAADGSQRALLALMAASQNRSDDAWDHVAALSGVPRAQEAALPHLMPGLATWSVNWTAGSHPFLLAGSGATLAPALPPPSVHAHEVVLGTGRIERRAMKIAGLHIGDAIVDLRVALEYEGLQIDVEHKGGGAARFQLRLPAPLDFEIASVYVDWARREGPTGAEIELDIAPGSEPVVVFARFEPLYVRWPTTLPKELDTTAREHGFVFIVDDADPERARIAGFAKALAQLLKCEARVAGEKAALAAAPAVSIDLRAGPDRERKFASLISQCERFALNQKP